MLSVKVLYQWLWLQAIGLCLSCSLSAQDIFKCHEDLSQGPEVHMIGETHFSQSSKNFYRARAADIIDNRALVFVEGLVSNDEPMQSVFADSMTDILSPDAIQRLLPLEDIVAYSFIYPLIVAQRYWGLVHSYSQLPVLSAQLPENITMQNLSAELQSNADAYSYLQTIFNKINPALVFQWLNAYRHLGHDGFFTQLLEKMYGSINSLLIKTTWSQPLYSTFSQWLAIFIKDPDLILSQQTAANTSLIDLLEKDQFEQFFETFSTISNNNQHRELFYFTQFLESWSLVYAHRLQDGGIEDYRQYQAFVPRDIVTVTEQFFLLLKQGQEAYRDYFDRLNIEWRNAIMADHFAQHLCQHHAQLPSSQTSIYLVVGSAHVLDLKQRLDQALPGLKVKETFLE